MAARRQQTQSNPPQVVAYTRVSTAEQSNSGLGLRSQRAALRTEAERRNWEHVRYLSDEGHSAKSLNRPAIQEALALLAEGKAGILMVSKLDRLSRSLLDFASIMERSQREGWSLVALDLGVDTTTAGGEMMANVMASFAQFERRLIGERTSAALQAAKQRGQRLGRPRQLSDKVIRRIATERAQGQTLGAIAEGLNTDRVPTAQGGARWYRGTVRAVLHSIALDREAATPPDRREVFHGRMRVG